MDISKVLIKLTFELIKLLYITSKTILQNIDYHDVTRLMRYKQSAVIIYLKFFQKHQSS